MSSHARSLSRIARERGWTLQQTNGNHYKLTHPAGPVVFASATPRCRGIFTKVLADMKRAERACLTKGTV